MPMSRLIVCFDGTWNTPDKGEKPTNVVKILRAIRNTDGDVRQITFYEPGVGTGGPVDHVVGGASGAGLTENMIAGYRFLANNYEDGDEVYVFGFSRGAYTARSLAGFVHLAGLFSPLHLGWDLHQAIDIYRDPDLKHEQKQSKIDALNLGGHPDIQIRCVGVWDTVGALGIPGDLGRRLVGKRFYFQDVQLSNKVRVALHAMAIDEKRSAFAPTLWVRKKGEPPVPGQVVEQVWFSGVHSNVGGSYKDEGLSDIALDWMLKRVRRHTGLAFDEAYIRDFVKPDAEGKGVESRTALYMINWKYPYQRLIRQIIPGGKGLGEWFRKTFKSMDCRSILPEGLETINEMIHISALKRWRVPVVWDCPESRECPRRAYRPVNLKAVIGSPSHESVIPVVGENGEFSTNGADVWPADN